VTHGGPKVLFKTCVAMKFVDDDDDNENANISSTFEKELRTGLV